MCDAIKAGDFATTGRDSATIDGQKYTVPKRIKEAFEALQQWQGAKTEAKKAVSAQDTLDTVSKILNRTSGSTGFFSQHSAATRRQSSIQELAGSITEQQQQAQRAVLEAEIRKLEAAAQAKHAQAAALELEAQSKSGDDAEELTAEATSLRAQATAEEVKVRRAQKQLDKMMAQAAADSSPCSSAAAKPANSGRISPTLASDLHGAAANAEEKRSSISSGSSR